MKLINLFAHKKGKIKKIDTSKEFYRCPNCKEYWDDIRYKTYYDCFNTICSKCKIGILITKESYNNIPPPDEIMNDYENALRWYS